MKIPLREIHARTEPLRAKRQARTGVKLPVHDISQVHVNQLAAIYMRVLREWAHGINTVILPAVLADRKEQAQTAADEIVLDAGTAVTGAVEGVNAVVNRVVSGSAADLRPWAATVEEWHRSKFLGGLKYWSSADLNSMIGPGDVQETLASAVARNMDLITNISGTVRTQITQAVVANLRNPQPIKQVAADLAAITHMQRDRAKRIASDQTVKLAAVLDQDRQEQVGITEFIWRHSGKVHFRPQHKARNGIVYEWRNNKLGGDLPGQLPYCGCKAQAYIPPDEEELPAVPVAPRKPRAPKVQFPYEAFQFMATTGMVERWAMGAGAVAKRFVAPQGVDIDGLNEVVHGVQEVNNRFGLNPIRFMGDVGQDNMYNWPPANPSALAAFSMGVSDTYLLYARGADPKVNTQNNVEIEGSAKLNHKFLVWDIRDGTKKLSKAAAAAFAKTTEWRWTVGTTIKDTAFHEMGHRLHGLYLLEIDAIAAAGFADGWQYVVSKYSATNEKELVAESFNLYMMGDESQFFRIYPPLLKFFKKLDLKGKRRVKTP